MIMFCLRELHQPLSEDLWLLPEEVVLEERLLREKEREWHWSWALRVLFQERAMNKWEVYINCSAQCLAFIAYDKDCCFLVSTLPFFPSNHGTKVSVGCVPGFRKKALENCREVWGAHGKGQVSTERGHGQGHDERNTEHSVGGGEKWGTLGVFLGQSQPDFMNS